MMRTFFVFLSCITLTISNIIAQNTALITRADSLRGNLTTFRSCYNVSFYDLEVQLDIKSKKIAGTNRIHFTATESFNTLQLDLYPYMEIHSIVYQGNKLDYSRVEGAVFVSFPQTVAVGTRGVIEVIFLGTPHEAVNPPWDGGWTWKADPKGNPWIGVSCEGEGASSWFPCKDHPTDEPDSVHVGIIIPQELVAVSNGNLRRILKYPGGKFKYEWRVSYPINLYNITINVGDYAEITGNYEGKYELNYYVLRDNETKARKHFEQVKDILRVYEKYFGEYPFPRDGYALVETPFWGMEHQSAIAYGNNYINLPLYPVDFIILHETAHEWFGNSLSMEDKADMWIHEAFASYAEVLYIEETMGAKKSLEYLESQHKARIKHIDPILAPRNVAFNYWEDSDMYFKGSMMLHTLRTAVNNDKLFFATLKKYCETFKHTIINTSQTITFFNESLGKDYTLLFYQYLKYTTLPTFTYKISHTYTKTKKETTLSYKWESDLDEFELPITIQSSEGSKLLSATTEWQSMPFPYARDFSIKVDEMQGLFHIKPQAGTITETPVPAKQGKKGKK